MFFVQMAAMHHCAAEGNQRKNVRQHHEVVEEIRQLPDKVVGENGAKKNKHNAKHGIAQVRFFSEEIMYIDAPEEIPADDGGKSEKQKADCNKGISERLILEGGAECKLGGVGFGNAEGCKVFGV